MPALPQEDLRKLHQEVNQIVQQRFLLTTTGLALFGVIVAWAIPRTPPGGPAELPLFTYFACLTLLVLLALLFVMHLSLKAFMRVLTTYLDEVGGSTWERDWAEWRERKFDYVGYSRPQTAIFVSLFAVTTSFPFVTAAIFRLTHNPAWATALLLVGSALTVAAAVVGWRLGLKGAETVYREHWKEIVRARLDAPSPGAGSPPGR